MLWRSTDKLWNASEHRRQDLEIAKEQELRAYVSWYAVEPLQGDQRKGRYFTFKNFGRTPAIEVEAVIGWQVGDASNPVLPELTHVPSGFLGTLMPDQVTPPLSFAFPPEMTDLGRAALEVEGKRLYASGAIRYLDVFGKRNMLTFRWQIVGDSFVLIGSGNTASYGRTASP